MAAPSQAGKTLTSTGPVIIVILVIAAALLGYYQIVYYPSGHSATSATIEIIPTTPRNATIYIPPGAPSLPTSQSFLPDQITVIVGYNSTVFWMNNDTALHTVTSPSSSPDPRFDAFGPNNPQAYNNIQPAGSSGDILNFTFTIPGNYSYICSYHPNMKGSVLVKAGTNAPSSSAGAILPSLSISRHFSPAVETSLARSLATLTGSGIAPWRVNPSSNLFATSSVIPAFRTKTS